MIRSSMRPLTASERAAAHTKNPFHVLFRTDTWQERKKALVEVLEFRIDKVWLVPGCDGGIGCCGVAGVLLRTPSKDSVYLSGRVDSSPAYNFSGRVYPYPSRPYALSWVAARWRRR
jgi:hypothetical protein